MISEQLEARLALTEASGMLNEAPGTIAQNLPGERLESSSAHERARDVLAIEPKPLRLQESDFTEVQWLRGVAVPSEEPQKDICNPH